MEKNKHKDKKRNAGWGGTGKSIVLVNRTGEGLTKQPTLHGFINENVETGSVVNTDDFKSYEKLKVIDHQ